MTGPTASGALSVAEIFRDPLVQELLAARVVAVLATTDARTAIHATPMWFAVEEESIVLATGRRSRKVGNLERDSRATLIVHDSRPGFEVCGASISGRVEILRGASARPLIETVHRRYVEERAERHRVVRDFLASDDLALRLTPETAWTWDERASEANAELRRLGAALPLVPTDPRD